MSPAHIHLLLNHVPIVGTLVGLLLLVAGLSRRSGTLERSAMTAFIITAVIAGVVYFTGEGAEDIVEGLPGVTEAVIEAHEEIAGTAIIVAAVLGLVAIVALLGGRGQERITSVMRATTLILAIGVFGLMAYTAALGGRIRHTEIRPGATASTQAEGGAEEDEKEPSAADDEEDEDAGE